MLRLKPEVFFFFFQSVERFYFALSCREDRPPPPAPHHPLPPPRHALPLVHLSRHGGDSGGCLSSNHVPPWLFWSSSSLSPPQRVLVFGGRLFYLSTFLSTGQHSTKYICTCRWLCVKVSTWTILYICRRYWIYCVVFFFFYCTWWLICTPTSPPPPPPTTTHPSFLIMLWRFIGRRNVLWCNSCEMRRELFFIRWMQTSTPAAAVAVVVAASSCWWCRSFLSYGWITSFFKNTDQNEAAFISSSSMLTTRKSTRGPPN